MAVKNYWLAIVTGFLICVNSAILPAQAEEVVEINSVKAVVTGPTTALAGTPVILDAVASKADMVRWVLPPRLDINVDKCDSRLFFVPAEEGQISFILVAVRFNPNITVDAVVHTVTVRLDGEDDDDRPTLPVPIPVLADFVEKTARELNDRNTAKNLADNLEKALVHIKTSSTLAVAKAVTRIAVEGALSQRRGDSSRVDWLNGWRRPVDAKIQEINPDNIASYAACIEQVIIGLRSSISN